MLRHGVNAQVFFFLGGNRLMIVCKCGHKCMINLHSTDPNACLQNSKKKTSSGLLRAVFLTPSQSYYALTCRRLTKNHVTSLSCVHFSWSPHPFAQLYCVNHAHTHRWTLTHDSLSVLSPTFHHSDPFQLIAAAVEHLHHPINFLWSARSL